MKQLRLGTRIAILSAVVVALGIVLCGSIATIYVLHAERDELDQQIRDEAQHFLQEWRRHGGRQFDWAGRSKEVGEWIAATTPPTLVDVADARGHTLFRSSSPPADFLAALPPGFHSISTGGADWRVGVFTEDGITLRLAGDLEGVNDLAEELATTFLIALPIVLTLVVLGGRFIASRALAPIQEITAIAERITAQDLGQRLPLPAARDEVHRLIAVLNATFDRLERSFQQATRFSADASHELKTPLTALRSSIEAMLRSPRHTLEAQRDLTGLLEETKRLSAIVESLLLLSRADAGKLELDLQRGDLSEVIRLCAEDAAILFDAQKLSMELQLPATAPALVNRTRLSQILMNLLENAEKYNRANGRVCITLVETALAWELRIANTGPAIPPENVPRLFTRFFRGEHSSEKAGQGLGLSLCRELARAHGGELVLVGSERDWTTFLLKLPKLGGPPLATPSTAG